MIVMVVMVVIVDWKEQTRKLVSQAVRCEFEDPKFFSASEKRKRRLVEASLSTDYSAGIT